MDEWYYYPLLVLTGFAVGFINTVAGGCTLLSLPVLFFLKMPPVVVNGTNRVAIVTQTALATTGFKSKGVSSLSFNIFLGISACLGSILGAYIAVDVNGATFNEILGIIMVVVVLIIIFKPRPLIKELSERLKGKYLWIPIKAFFFIGIYGGFINAGIGFIITFFLQYVNRMNLFRVYATNVTVVFLNAVSALAVFISSDKVIWEGGLILAIGDGSGA